MAKVKILVGFIDKYTGANYKVGDEVEFTSERIKEVNATTSMQLVKEIKEDKAPKKKGNDK